jgi:hypothetical protein
MAHLNILFAVLGGLFVWLTVWCIFDAFDRTDYGMVWLFFFLTLSPIFVPLYLIMRFYSDRNVPAKTVLAGELERERWRDFRIGSEIERAKFIEQAMQGGGTMYDPNASLHLSTEGYRHFSDQRAEELLQHGNSEDAWQYLSELYGIARADGDLRALDTYRHYICRIPGGAARLAQRQAAETTAEAQSMPASLAAGTLKLPKARREVPF